MNVIRSFRNLDRHGQQRAPEVIEEELRQLEPHLARFREDLVRLEVVASQTRGKTRIKVSLRLAAVGRDRGAGRWIRDRACPAQGLCRPAPRSIGM